MLEHDPNGIDLPDWKRYGYASYEAWISEKAGATWTPPPSVLPERFNTTTAPHDWPQDRPPPYEADDEGKAEPHE